MSTTLTSRSIGQLEIGPAGPCSELWRRTIQEADRELARLGKRLGVELRRRYVKVYEFQARGVIHYHAGIRLDGYHPDCPGAIVPPDRVVTRAMFADVLETAFRRTAYTTTGHPANGGNGWRIAWGHQGLDLKHINAPGGDDNLAKLTGYLAKYVTKSTEVTGQVFRRIDDLTIELHATPDTHLGRLIRACWNLGLHDGWHRLRRYAHQYGYGGHITTKSRAFSVTYGFLRLQRTIWRRTQGFPHLWDDQQADQGEVLGLAVDDIDFDKEIVRVRRQVRIVRAKLVFAEPKGRKTREVPLPSSVAHRLREHIAEFPPRSIALPWETPTGKPMAADLIIYGVHGGAINRGDLNKKVWWPAARKSGIPQDRKNGMHALRHFYASTLLDAGESIKALANYLGHADPGFTLRTYTHLMPSSEERTRKAIDQAFGYRSASRPNQGLDPSRTDETAA